MATYLKLGMCIALFQLAIGSEAKAKNIAFDIGFTTNCVKFSDDYEQCVGKSAGACSDATVFGGTLDGMARCVVEELKYWDARMNALAAKNKEIFADESQHALDTFTAMQDSWVIFRNADCAFEASLMDQADAAISIPLCKMKMTAQQVQHLEMILGDEK